MKGTEICYKLAIWHDLSGMPKFKTKWETCPENRKGTRVHVSEAADLLLRPPTLALTSVQMDRQTEASNIFWLMHYTVH